MRIVNDISSASSGEGLVAALSYLYPTKVQLFHCKPWRHTGGVAV